MWDVLTEDKLGGWGNPPKQMLKNPVSVGHVWPIVL
jgi:hypothetical protein